MGARPAPGDHPGIARNPGNRPEHLRRRRRQRDHPRARLGVPETQLSRRPVHVVPTQGQDLVEPAAGQHQKTQRCHRLPPDPASPLRRVHYPAQPPVLFRRQEPLARMLPVLDHEAAGVAALRGQAPRLGQGEHLGENHQRPVRRAGRIAKPVMQRRGMLPPDRFDRQLSQCRQDMVAERSPVDPGGVRVAVHRHMPLHVALRQTGHGEPGRWRRGDRILAPLDAVDDASRLAARLFGRDLAMPAQGDALRPARPPALDDVDFPARGIDPHPVARQIMIPEDGVLRGGEPVDGPLRYGQVVSLWHRALLQSVSECSDAGYRSIRSAAVGMK